MDYVLDNERTLNLNLNQLQPLFHTQESITECNDINECRMLVFLRKQIRDVKDTNIVLPQSSTSQVGSSSACICHLLIHAVWTLEGLPAERTLTIKSAKGLSESQISD